MPYVVRCSFLLISICIGSMSWPVTEVQVIKASGHDIIIECATDKKPQDGVYMYMYKQEGAKPQDIFYFYKDDTLTFKTMNKSKASVSGALPKLNVTLSHVTAEDIGFYWCEFNLEDQITVGRVTWLWIEKEEKDCPEDVFPHVKIFPILCAAMCLLLFIVFLCVILKMKGCWGNRKYMPSNPPSDIDETEQFGRPAQCADIHQPGLSIY